MNNQELQLVRIGQFAEWHIAPCLERWRRRDARSEHSYRELHLGHTLLELIAWLSLGSEIEFFPGTEANAIVRRLFSELGGEYKYLVDHWSSEWGSEMRAALELAYAAEQDRFQFQTSDFRKMSSGNARAIYETSLGLIADFTNDEAAQDYLSAQAFFETSTWDSQQVPLTIRNWSRSLDSVS
jgi:hypothetical protein